LFNGEVTVYLPEQFKDLSEMAAQEKYPSINRPQVIKANSENTANFTFSLLEENSFDFPMTAEFIWEEIDRIFPRNVLYDTGIVKSEDLETLWLEYKSFSVEKEVYNILFIVKSKGKNFIVGTFNCPFISYDIWKPCVLEIINNIMIQENTNEGI
jgi:hypothetical protein